MSQSRVIFFMLAAASSFALSPPAITHGLRPYSFSRGLIRIRGPGYLQLANAQCGSLLPLGRVPAHRATRRSPVATAGSDNGQDDATDPDPPPTPLLMLIVGMQSACFGCIGTALPPALRMSGMEPAAVALLLGRLGSASALVEVLLSGSFGKLTDAFGRKPVLLAAPALTVLARSLVVFNPTIPVLLAVRLFTTLTVPIYWLALSACNADLYGRSATQLAIINSRIQAGMGLGFAISSIIGGWLAAIDIRFAYAASCLLGCGVFALHLLFFRETLPAHRRIPFQWSGMSPFAFVNLFRRSPLSAKLNTVVLLQSLTNGMGDLWQVVARELRGWGAAQCGRFAALAGIGTMLGTLLTGPSIRRLGARGHTVASTACSAASAAILGGSTSNAMAFGGVVPMALGSGKGMAVSARIVNLGTELGVPQGRLSAERNTLNAIIKVVAPSMYASLFAFGAARGVLGLPFYSTAVLLVGSALMAASIPAAMWQSSRDPSSTPKASDGRLPPPDTSDAAAAAGARAGFFGGGLMTKSALVSGSGGDGKGQGEGAGAGGGVEGDAAGDIAGDFIARVEQVRQRSSEAMAERIRKLRDE